MNQASEIEQWFALMVKPRHEKVVSGMLKNKGYETLLPLYRQRHTYSQGRFKVAELPLFPGYVFCRFNPLVRLPVLTTPGVFYVAGNGRVPLPVEDHEIVSLQTLVKAGGAAQPCEYLQVGQRVRITEGPLSGVEGILVHIKESPRLVLSVGLLQRSVLAEVDRDWVTAFSPVPWMPAATCSALVPQSCR